LRGVETAFIGIALVAAGEDVVKAKEASAFVLEGVVGFVQVQFVFDEGLAVSGGLGGDAGLGVPAEDVVVADGVVNLERSIVGEDFEVKVEEFFGASGSRVEDVEDEITAGEDEVGAGLESLDGLQRFDEAIVTVPLALDVDVGEVDEAEGLGRGCGFGQCVKGAK